ncbi:Predicted membrane protein [Slackia heliotrinireducens]|uniref:Predicted integral membrane protein n=1 Tax=Slackia heliotrinireducens (strain ATCC 29202 / DSM 20476 / NCTC 11029 / RHS 1) TaxID=471855 RepID=C7N193_SLAHD|nr:DUF975 family protein [Slackia heliotrinireducens]ACV23315.1 predicted integral membrane protein [Slackia heliotrinireducens DSM 20476]VEH02515.1 Predicted membrane protein [Slackia heliotrinireducens]
MWTRKELKEKGKWALKQNYWKAVLVGLLLMAISGSLFGGPAPGGSPIDDDNYTIETEADSVSVVDTENDLAYEIYTDSPMAGPEVAVLAASFGLVLLLVFAVLLVMSFFIFNPLMVGVQRFFLRDLNQRALVKEVAYGFDNNYRENVKTMFFRDLFIFLWSLLLIIPGIVKSYEYRMIPYLLADDPTMTKDVAFAESKRMMTGQKWNAFVLDLSFIGWCILSIFTLGILSIFYVAPYQAHTNAALYEKLRYGMPAPESVAAAPQPAAADPTAAAAAPVFVPAAQPPVPSFAATDAPVATQAENGESPVAPDGPQA